MFRAASAPWVTSGCGTRRLGGLPPEEFLTAVDPLSLECAIRLNGRYETSDHIAGHLVARLGRAARTARRHPDSSRRVRRPLGRHRRRGSLGRCSQRGRHVHLHHGHQREARPDSGRLRSGRRLECIPASPGSKQGFPPPAISSTPSRAAPGPRSRSFRAASKITRAGDTGLLRLTWDNGDRTVLVNPELSGVTLGWSLTHTAQDELFAAIEGTAFHTRVILERMEEHGVPVQTDDQWRRHSAAQRSAQSGLRQRDGQTDPGAQGRRHEPRFRDLRVSRRGNFQDCRRGAGLNVRRTSHRGTRPCRCFNLSGVIPAVSKTIFFIRRKR